MTAFFFVFAGLKTSTRWALVQLLQLVEPACVDPLLVIFYISPSSAISMTPMALLDILDEDLAGAHLTPASIGQVAGLILATGLFSFMLIFAEVREPETPNRLGGASMLGGCWVTLAVWRNDGAGGCAVQKGDEKGHAKGIRRTRVGSDKRARRNLTIVGGCSRCRGSVKRVL